MNGQQIFPNFLICGAQKAGTTSLYAYLNTHPEVFMPRTKEVHYFDLNYDRGLSWYLAYFKKKRATKASAVGEASPSYMYFEDVPGRIRELFPAMKLLFVLRNPVERAYAHYWHEVALGYENLSFKEAIEKETERLGKGMYYKRHFSYRDRGRYVVQLQRFLQHFAKGQLHVLSSDDLRTQTLTALGSVCEFLGISSDSKLFTNAKHQYLRTRSPRNRVVHRAVINIFGPDSIVACRLLAPFTTRVGYPPMEDHIRDELTAYYQPYNKELEAFLGTDLCDRWSSRHAI